MRSVVLINPPTPGSRKFTRNADCAAESKGNYLWQPYDFLLLSGAFADSVHVHFIDAVAEELDVAQVLARVQQCNGDLLITAIVDVLWSSDLAFLQRLRKLYPDKPILCFGDALIEEQNARTAWDSADGIVVNPFRFHADLLVKWTREEIRQNSLALGLRRPQEQSLLLKTVQSGRSLSPRHQLFLHPRYRWPFASFKKYTTITTSWGCPYSCSYCTGASLESRYRPAENILQEMRGIRDLGIKEIYFSDKSFGLPAANTLEVLDGMIRENFNFSWSTYIHPNQFSVELFDKMRASGCHTVIIGIETPKLDQLRKMGRVISQNKLEDLLQYAYSHGLNVCGDFILGLPEDSESDVQALISYSLSLPIDYASYNIATPLPGSSIKAAALAAGTITSDDHHFDSSGGTRTMDSPHIRAQRLLELRTQAVRRFYLRPGYLIGRLKRIRGWQHFQIQFEEMLELFRKQLGPRLASGAVRKIAAQNPQLEHKA